MNAPRALAPSDQLGFYFEDEQGLPLPNQAMLGQTGLPIPAMPTPTKNPARKFAAVSSFSATESLKEANRLIDEGCLVRYASVQRRMKLRGPINFDVPAPVIADVRDFSELIPKFLKKQPPGWVISDEGFVYSLVGRTDAPTIAKAINARSDELGVYLCKKDTVGWRLVFEF